MPERDQLHAIGRGYDRVASVYDHAVKLVFGDTLSHFQHSVISHLPQVEHLLIIGGGSGMILRDLINQQVAQRYTYAEASSKMEAKARSRLQVHEAERIDFIRDFEQVGQVDTIVLPFILDCYPTEEVRSFIEYCTTKLKPGGNLVIIDFNLEPVQGFKGSALKAAFIQLLYLFFQSTGGVLTSRLPPIFTIADKLIPENKKIASVYSGWVLAKQYQTESK